MWDAVLPNLIVTVVGLFGAWIVGNALAVPWQLIRRRKELELELAESFYKYYGEFFFIWKVWHQLIENSGKVGTFVQKPKIYKKNCCELAKLIEEDIRSKAYVIVVEENEISEQSRNDIHDRAAKLEAGIEATLLKMASEIKLSEKDLYNLGQLRQAFSVVRYCIRHRIDVPFYSSDDAHYRELKRLSTACGMLLARPLKRRIFAKVPIPTAEEAHEAWLEITDNKHESCWKGYLRSLCAEFEKTKRDSTPTKP